MVRSTAYLWMHYALRKMNQMKMNQPLGKTQAFRCWHIGVGSTWSRFILVLLHNKSHYIPLQRSNRISFEIPLQEERIKNNWPTERLRSVYHASLHCRPCIPGQNHSICSISLCQLVSCGKDQNTHSHPRLISSHLALWSSLFAKSSLLFA